MNAEKKCKRDDPAFTQVVDKQIIEGFIKDRQAAINELTRLGLSRDEIIRRSVELGMNGEFFVLIRRGGVDPAARKCLRCNKYFASLGAHNRLCARCRSKS
jgi:hypothetical protein